MIAARVAAALGAAVLVITIAGCGLRDRAPRELDPGVDGDSTQQSTETAEESLNQILDALGAADAAFAQVDGDLSRGEASETEPE
jgi:hypothetical protein